MASNLDSQRVVRFYLAGMSVCPPYRHQFNTMAEMTGVCQSKGMKPEITLSTSCAKPCTVSSSGSPSQIPGSLNAISQVNLISSSTSLDGDVKSTSPTFKG